MIKLRHGNTAIGLSDAGAPIHIETSGIMINQVDGNALDGSMAGLYLRDGTSYRLLTGAESRLNHDKEQVSWEGVFSDVSYSVRLTIGDSGWYWTVDLDGEVTEETTLTYVQDLGLGAASFVQSNEAYASQYIDHFVARNGQHITIASRQNQPQSGKNPYLQQGAFTPLASYATDGMQFFGPAYRADASPVGMQAPNLANVKLQYEATLIALRTPAGQAAKHAVFYAAFLPDQPQDNRTILLSEIELQADYQRSLRMPLAPRVYSQIQTEPVLGPRVSGIPLKAREIMALFPARSLEERQDGDLLSFFLPDHRHVVLQAKELLQQRQTGNIVMAGHTLTPTTPVLATTQFMAGVFESHTVYGNTNMQNLTSDVRDPFNFFTTAGRRIYIKLADQQFHLLSLPSAFEMAYNGATWYYQLEDDLLIITDDAAADSDQLTLHFQSQRGNHYDLLITDQLNAGTMGHQPVVVAHGEQLSIKAESGMPMHSANPDLTYWLDYSQHDGRFELGDTANVLGEVLPSLEMVTASYRNTSDLKISTALANHFDELDAATMRKAHAEHIEDLLHHLTLKDEAPARKDDAQEITTILRWFAHDALVHLLSPHGLEQYGGAAWGTRDVSQGPVELFLATGHYAEVRQILTTLYSHQFVETGNWPQWFMYDEYRAQFADESHGDVVVWPLKVLGDYLKATHDLQILDEQLPYMSATTHDFIGEKTSLRAHVEHQLDYLVAHFLAGTHVSAYGDGDWDDTLQPADPAQKATMASTWTEELTLETLTTLTSALPEGDALQHRAAALKAEMATDFQRYFMRDDVLPGFIQIAPDGRVKEIIHPGDQQTGIDYRLLPLSQGVLSGILTGKQADHALALIDQHLLFPDGVRLMNRPSTYRGGVSKIFKRAEQAANFGREIGLLYVHAHIRYAGALAVAGRRQEAWQMLQLVDPIKLTERVSNAELRQANVYFSSSDADFADRYQAQNDFERVRAQQVGVKGGWRLYSSGPGIFIGTLLSEILSIRNETFNRESSTDTADFDPNIRIDWQPSKDSKIGAEIEETRP
ncbi:GH36-type glycosyl hydrolase domain-containing protein [Lacticaseibacillus mingshuiensis]|uniref:GH36-type glycosyl hydrolase domain-containing protein n=1 Tax=Lacticaseibacillus mingshuiensis TaxID=2799574 RepID=UPI00195019EE|nr:cellobiose phosphorylase [Lacticaseibacillus mingshuiensis]